MIVKILLLTVCAGALAQVDLDAFETLQQQTNKAGRKVLEVADSLRDPTEDYLELISERRECLEWEHVTQKQNINDSVSVAVSKAMLRDNQFSSFYCIGEVGQASAAKIDASANYIQNATTRILEKGLDGIRALRLITPGLYNYVQDLYRAKSKDMEKAKNEEERMKILGKALQKLKLLDGILAEFENKAKAIKFKFFEDYVKYAFDTETALRKLIREATQKMLKCVS